MRVLALDTTTRAGSVAVVDGDAVLVEARGDPSRSHAERLPGELQRALSAAGLQVADIDLYAVASGPGSFTGLRIGIATIQGLAFVARKRVAPVSALLALASMAAIDAEVGTTIGAWMDAHRHQVFTALYRAECAPGPGVPVLAEVEGPSVDAAGATWDRWAGAGAPPSVVIGDGAPLYAEAIGDRARVLDAPPIAGMIGRIAVGRASHGETVDPAGVQPLYVRRPDAEVARDALRTQTAGRGPA